MDLDSLFKRAFDGFGSVPEAVPFPGLPGSPETSGNGQHIDNNKIFRCSRISRSEKEDPWLDQNSEPKKINDFSFGIARASSLLKHREIREHREIRQKAQQEQRLHFSRKKREFRKIREVKLRSANAPFST